MIAFLRGRVAERRADEVVMDVGGVGYLVAVSSRTLGDLGAAEEAELLIYAHQPADSPLQLFGFYAAEERDLFALLLAVHGVGPRLAQTLVGGFAPGQLEAAIAGGDVASLRRVKGIGAKTAERVVLELKSKVHVPAGTQAGRGRPGASANTALTGPAQELVAALVGLGYRPAEAEQAVARASRRMALESGAASDHELLQEALREVQAL